MRDGKFSNGFQGEAEAGILEVHASQEKAVVAHTPGFLMPAALPSMARIFNVMVGDEPMAAKP